MDFLDFFGFLNFFGFEFFFVFFLSSEGRSPPQEVEVGQRSGPYLLVESKLKTSTEDWTNRQVNQPRQSSSGLSLSFGSELSNTFYENISVLAFDMMLNGPPRSASG